MDSDQNPSSLSLEDDVARLIINHFRWLDFVVDPNALAEKLMQVLSVCPLHLKKEIIGSLPEIIGDQNNKTVVQSLEKMLEEDSAVVVAVLDSFSNLNLDSELQEQVSLYLSLIYGIQVVLLTVLVNICLVVERNRNRKLSLNNVLSILQFLVSLSFIGRQK